MVEHTHEERLIYRQACHDQGTLATRSRLEGFLQSLMACEGLGLDLREGGKAFCRLDGFRVSCFGIWVFSCL